MGYQPGTAGKLSTMDRFDDDVGGDALEPDVDGEDADLWTKPLIEYWIWTGTRLVPASADQTDRQRGMDAFQRLELWKQRLEREQRRSRRSQWSRQAFAWVRAQARRAVVVRSIACGLQAAALQHRSDHNVRWGVAGNAARVDGRESHPQSTP